MGLMGQAGPRSTGKRMEPTPCEASGAERPGRRRPQRDELMKNVVASTTERPLGIYNEYNWSYNFWGHVYENALFKPHVSERDTVILCLPGYLIVEIGLDYSFMVTSYTSNTMVKKFTNNERQDYREWKCGPLRVCLLGDTSEVRLIRDDGGPSSNPNRIEVRVCPNTGKAALSTSKVRITASDDHMFVRRGTKNQSRYHSCQMHSDIHNKFEVRASGHAAGFNEDGKFTIY
ncbi:unnamed protein product [Cyprideis torosa]|uniref:Uncharacterized protein n=1 Tax=Cyprideis torosa TaxID=163714 RepID=A0A7R8W1J8_9CRUS|nr:unnamed protein product [Cyprideis torosa]CAG0880969.1 unnamed protein product [Cyprideis torosa]